jgi:hypothetical protein
MTEPTDEHDMFCSCPSCIKLKGGTQDIFKSDPTLLDSIDEITEGYYRWCMQVVAEAFKIEPLLGTGSAKPLSPTKAKQAIKNLLLEAHLQEVVLIAKANADAIDGETWRDWSWRILKFLEKRKVELQELIT